MRNYFLGGLAAVMCFVEPAGAQIARQAPPSASSPVPRINPQLKAPGAIKLGEGAAGVVDVVVTVVGQGTVSWSPKLCGPGPGVLSATCKRTEAKGSRVEFTATPREGMKFTGWSGDCSSEVPVCNVKADGNLELAANFGPMTYSTLTVTYFKPVGSTVELKTAPRQLTFNCSTPSGDSGVVTTVCQAKVPQTPNNQTLVLTAIRAGQPIHTNSWGGDCMHNGDMCMLDMTADRNATIK